MPGSITHCLFAKDCLSKINSADMQNTINNNFEIYLLGCQGPNFFSYSNYLPFLSNQNLSEIGDKIHTQYINEFFKSMILYCNNTSTIRYIFSDSNFRDITLSYLYGFISHYALDKHAHPLIYSLQFSLCNQYKRKSSKALHKSIETHIDKLLLKEFKNISPIQFNEYKKTTLNKKELIIICDMYSFLIKKIYGKSLSYNNISKCLNMFENAEKMLNKNTLHSKTYLKFKSILSKSSDIDSKIYLNHNLCINDLLNINNSIWIDPFTNKKSSESFSDIYNSSLEFYISFMDNLYLYLYLNNEKTISELTNMIDDNSYLTNQSWKINYNNI